MSVQGFTRHGIVKAIVLALACSTASANEILPPVGPMPSMRPDALARGVAIDPSRFGAAAPHAPNPLTVAPDMQLRRAPDGVDTGATAFTASISAMSARPTAIRAIAGELAGGMKALQSGDVARARAIREGMPATSLDRHILAWAIAMNGGPDVPSYDIARAASDLRGWPGMKRLRANSERAMYREQPTAENVIAAFGNSRPETPEGAIVLARALIETGRAGDAKRLISRVWREDTLDRFTEGQILKQFQTLLTRGDHKRRMDMLLYADRVAEAERMKTLAGAERIFAARAASIRGASNAGALIAAVPAAQRADPGMILAEVEYRRKQGDVAGAANLLAKAPREADLLVAPDAWWNERRIVARDLLDLGDAKAAYRIASAHSAESGPEAAEAEFHAGWIALRFLRDPKTAASHFSRIGEVSRRPLSQSRAFYWLGRAAEAGGSGSASGYYARAAAYSTTFYGQLAAARLGVKPAAVSYPKPSSAERQRFDSREAVRAIRRLEQIGMESRADAIYRNLADELDSPGELAMLAQMAEQRGDHYLSLKMGKLANQRGVDAPALAFPIGVIPQSANISPSGKALAYAIARQESEFNPAARSSAGALGLLQLMPATAKSVAQKSGLPYSPGRLISDVGYNATLGSSFLGEQIDNFGGSYILTFAAYNAGPRRAREWVQRFGDPRGRPIEEVVDWIERIPFTETRNYVQRVMENYQVYKMRLGADGNIARDLVSGRRGG